MNENIECGRSIPDDEDCDYCGAIAERTTCDTCGVSARITNCGHFGQPRPIAGDDMHSGVEICDVCYVSREEV